MSVDGRKKKIDKKRKEKKKKKYEKEQKKKKKKKPKLRALPDHDGPFLDLATAHQAYEHGGADTLRAQTREQVIRMTLAALHPWQSGYRQGGVLPAQRGYWTRP